jgi:DNA invertase Pin-like site-specific DNA recombinase
LEARIIPKRIEYRIEPEQCGSGHVGSRRSSAERNNLNSFADSREHSIETLLPNGKRNPAAGIMLALLAEIARNESETLRERIKSGLALARKRGVLLGRRKGTTLSRDRFLQKHKDIVRQIRAGLVRAQYGQNRRQGHFHRSASESRTCRVTPAIRSNNQLIS